jgi:uroporphyrinogen III methyltransferase / synthase
MDAAPTGKVYLVGAGPGDPGLLTLRAKACLEQAEVVVYDALVDPAVLRHAPQAERVYVGKQAGRHSLPQEEITRILLEQASKYRHVVRLKGGDPFIFGRGGEEALALARARVPYEVVPGVTAATAAAAYAGIPLTHRGLAASVSFITGHTGGGEDPVPDLSRLLHGSLVFYMGLKNLPGIAAQLERLGRVGTTPAAVIEWGTYARQRTVCGTLGDIAGLCAEAEISAPALLLVGEVVGLREELNWFEARPLFGLRVALTHTAQRQGPLEARLLELGASLYAFPTIELAPAPRPPLPVAPGSFDWIVFTSANGVEMLFAYLEQQGLDARALAGARLCAVGTTTSDTLRRRYLHVDAQPEGYEPEALLAALGAAGSLAGSQVLLPRSDIARAAVADVLRSAGAQVTEWQAYEKRAPAASQEAVEDLLRFEPEVVVFTNAGAARNFARLLGPERLARLKTSAAFASIGPVTTRAAEELGLAVHVSPERHDVLHLVEALCQWRRGEGRAVDS